MIFLGYCGSVVALAASGAGDLALRFPQPRISERQWGEFRAEIMARPGAEIIARPEAPDITVIAVPGDYTLYYFTERGAAHPAVIVARVVALGGAVSVHHSGYFAGAEPAFRQWLLAVTKQAEEATRPLETQSPERP